MGIEEALQANTLANIAAATAIRELIAVIGGGQQLTVAADKDPAKVVEKTVKKGKTTEAPKTVEVVAEPAAVPDTRVGTAEPIYNLKAFDYPEVDFKGLRELVFKVNEAKGRDAAMSILERFGAGNSVRNIKEEFFACAAALSKHVLAGGTVDDEKAQTILGAR